MPVRERFAFSLAIVEHEVSEEVDLRLNVELTGQLDRCEIDPDRVAVWWSQRYFLRLSALAAEVLVSAGRIPADSLKLWRE